jgi:hypothetical protein
LYALLIVKRPRYEPENGGESPDSKKWTLDTIKEKIPAECKATINCGEKCPGNQEAIKMFEVRSLT